MSWSPHITYAFRLKVLFSTMYHAALRVSETCPSKLTDHALRLSNLVVLKNSILITFVSFKHSAGETVSLKLLKSNVKGCAVSLLKSWLKMNLFNSFYVLRVPIFSFGTVHLEFLDKFCRNLPECTAKNSTT